MDEFEFRPITQGLGFHKKSVDLKDEMTDAGVSKDAFQGTAPPAPKHLVDSGDQSVASIKEAIASLPAIDFDNSETTSTPVDPEKAVEALLTEPLPRESAKISEPAKKETVQIPKYESPLYTDLPVEPSITPTPSKVPVITPDDEPVKEYPPIVGVEISKKSDSIKTIPKLNMSGLGGGPLLRETPFNPVAALFDLVVVFALSILFTVALLVITEVDLWVVLENAKTDIATQVSIVALVLCVLELYLLISRSFVGNTLGEWTFEIHLGTSNQQKKIWYPIAVLWRSLFIALTGFVVFPILSMITRKDLTGIFSRVKLYKYE